MTFCLLFLGCTRKSRYFCSDKYRQSMDGNEVLDRIRKVAYQVLPKGSTLYLYGSRARGDARKDSDWDLRLLLDKPRVT